MKKNISYSLVVIFLISVVVTSCSMIGASGQSAEVEALSEQVNVLSTQNALLVDQNAQIASNQQTNQQGNQQAQAALPTETQTQFVIPTATLESLPIEPVMAGVPIIYDGWSIMVDQEFVVKDYNDGSNPIFLTIYLNNLEQNDRIFRWTNSSVRLFDNNGNEFLPQSDATKCYYEVKNITISGDSQFELGTNVPYYSFPCDDDKLVKFEGPIPLEAGHLIVKFDNFGPFSGVEVVIDL